MCFFQLNLLHSQKLMLLVALSITALSQICVCLWLSGFSLKISALLKYLIISLNHDFQVFFFTFFSCNFAVSPGNSRHGAN